MKQIDSTRTEGSRTGLLFGALLWMLLAATVVGSYAAVQRWWFPPLASLHGAEIDKLMNLFFIVVGSVFIGVHVVMALFVIRYRRRDDQPALHWHESKKLELIWTVIPAIILVIMTVVGGNVWARIHKAPPQDAVTVEVTAQQFGWTMRYPGPDGTLGRTNPKLISGTNPLGMDAQDPTGADDIVVPAELRLPVDRPVHVLLRAKDVIHSFFVPSFRVKQDMMPGRTTEVTFVPTKVGDYELACAELCGAGHWVMRGVVKVVPQADFDAWLADTAAGRGES